MVKAALESLPENRKRLIAPSELSMAGFFKGQGCEKCSGLGYKGQIGIFEILQITDEIKQMILTGDISEQRLKEVAVKNGMVSLVQDGILKAMRGVTSLEEVFRVAQ